MSRSSEPEVAKCAHCGAVNLLGEIIFTEPEEENTQYGWLVGVCPSCKGDLKVSYDRVARDLAARR